MEEQPGTPNGLHSDNISTVTSAIDALRIVKKTPAWYQSPEINPSDVLLQPGDQVQPDNAFSRTTVTVSYVSRSHVFPPCNALSRSTPLFSTSPISNFSLRSRCEKDNELGQEAGHVLTQHDSERTDESVNLALRPQERPGSNDDVNSLNNHLDVLQRHAEERCPSQEVISTLENGQTGGATNPVVGFNSSPDTREDDKVEKTELIKNQDFVVVLNESEMRDLHSLSMDYQSPLEDAVSPSATSLDGTEDVFTLPRASGSPSEGYFSLDATEAVRDASTTEKNTKSDSSANNELRRHRRKTPSEPLTDLTNDVVANEHSGGVPRSNGGAKTPEKKKLPFRSSRGTRLEAIVMNINSSRYSLTRCILGEKKARTSKSPKDPGTSLVQKKTNTRRPATKQKEKSRNSRTDCSKKSASDSESVARKKQNIGSPKGTTRSKKKAKHLARTKKKSSHRRLGLQKKVQQVKAEPSAEVNVLRSSSSPSVSPKKSQTKSPARRVSPAKPTKRRRKKHKPSQPPSLFSPKEPEIKLRCLNFREQKREHRSERFSPFIRVERRQASPSRCSIINYPEEAKSPHGKQAHASDFVSSTVPSTSSLQLGRVSAHGSQQRPLVCCLCGQSANVTNLGDLHGPYYPEGYQISTKPSASTSNPKEDREHSSNSDSSSCGGRRKKRLLATARSLRSGVPPNQKNLSETRRRTGDGSGSPVAKRNRSEGLEDWYSPPVLPSEPCEYWLHEDCSIWSTGVFLVKGKVYGLVEAVGIAQETVCSACQNPGATLGCFFKGCPNKYHYRCAVESDCVLIQENFSMKCKKHKNKPTKAPPESRWDDR